MCDLVFKFIIHHVSTRKVTKRQITCANNQTVLVRRAGGGYAVSLDAVFEYGSRCHPNRLNSQGKDLGLVTIKSDR